MNKPDKAPFAPYYQLRNEIDALCESLEKVHQQHLNCRKGCDLCCMAISVFPVEFYAIKEEVNKMSVTELRPSQNDLECRYLVDHQCVIYKSRPVICRTHGMPLLYQSLESDGFELSCCELNFTNFDLEGFDEENTYPMYLINSRLYQINKTFVTGFEDGKFSETDRIPLAELLLASGS